VKGNIYQQYSITLTDDDYAPLVATLATSQTIYSENFNTFTGWGVANSAGAINIWRHGTNAGTSPRFGAANNCAYVSQNTTGHTYNSASGASRLQSPVISTLNTSNLQLTFDYVCNGELSGGVHYDYGTLEYSIDGGTNWLPINSTRYQGTTIKTTITVPLPDEAANAASLKIGFRWDNDNSVENQPPYGVDNIVLRGDVRTPATVQAIVNSGISAGVQYLGPNGTVHFYDNVTGHVMATIENLTAHDYGCTTLEVDRSGSSSQYISGDISLNPKQRITDKTFRVIPANNSVAGDYRITLYYTAAEKTGYESSSSRLWIADNGVNNGTRVAKHSGAINALTISSSGVLSLIESVGTYGTGTTITARFSGGFSGFAVGVPPMALVPVSIIDFTAVKKMNAVQLNWSVAQQINMRTYEVLHSADGNNFRKIGSVEANSEMYAQYEFMHLQPARGYNFYRLKMLDADGSFKYSSIVKVEFGNSLVQIAPNPVKDHFKVLYNNAAISKLWVIDASGRETGVRYMIQPGSADVDATNLPAGVYIIRIADVNGKIVSERFIRN
jgi:hypothetical protein